MEVLDLFESTYGALNTLLKQTYQGLVRYAPTVWSGVFSVFDNPALFRRQMDTMGKLRDSLAAVLHDTEPDVVVSTLPGLCPPDPGHLPRTRRAPVPVHYGRHGFDQRLLGLVSRAERPVCGRQRADGQGAAGGGHPERIASRRWAFPVSPIFARERPAPLTAPRTGDRRKVLYVINTGKAKAGKSIDRLLKIPDLDLTITVGRDASLKAKLTERLREYGDRVHVYGWTNQMPRLLMSHHLVIGKAGGAMVQEAIAARCPMIINQVIPGQEEGNARLIEKLGRRRGGREKQGGA